MPPTPPLGSRARGDSLYFGQESRPRSWVPPAPCLLVPTPWTRRAYSPTTSPCSPDSSPSLWLWSSWASCSFRSWEAPLKLVEWRGSWWPAEVAILTATSAVAPVVVLVLMLLYVLQVIVVVVVEVKVLEGKTTDSRRRNASSWCFSVCSDVYDWYHQYYYHYTGTATAATALLLLYLLLLLLPQCYSYSYFDSYVDSYSPTPTCYWYCCCCCCYCTCATNTATSGASTVDSLYVLSPPVPPPPPLLDERALVPLLLHLLLPLLSIIASGTTDCYSLLLVR